MAAMAAGDKAAVFMLYEEFGDHLRACMRRELRRLGADDASAEDVEGLAIDACFVLFDCGAAWRVDGGALPWTWAARRMAGVASRWVGQHADEFDAVRTEVGAAPGPTATAAGRDEDELDVLARMAAAGGHAGCALVLEALERVANPRDRAIVLELRSQQAAGDPSPARTVARRHDVSPDVVRQVVCRVRARLRTLAGDDPRFAGLADLAIVA
jgi:hypothetical protein